MKEKRETSPWVWIGCGCGGCVVFLVVAVMGAGYFGFRAVSDFRDALVDPEVRAERVLEILGADELPPGYEAQMFFRIPFAGEMAMIGDGSEPGFEDGAAFRDSLSDESRLGEHFFVYLHLSRMQVEAEDLREMILGRQNNSNVQIELGYRFRASGEEAESVGAEPQTSGDFEIPGGRVDFQISRGELGGISGDWTGVAAVLVVHCDDESRGSRGAGWFVRDGLVASSLDGDEARQFLASFDLCGANR